MGVLQAWRRVSMYPAIRPLTEVRVYARWHRAGRPIPAPPIVKQRIVKKALRSHGIDTVVETGTFTGEMVDALVGTARHIVSIELDDALYAAAVRRFAGKQSVELLHGDSTTLLAEVARRFTAPVLFWLDAHYAGGGTARTDVASPIMREVDVLLEQPVKGHVVLIDDARQFCGSDGYPTVAVLAAYIHARQPQAPVEVADDIIRWITTPSLPS